MTFIKNQMLPSRGQNYLFLDMFIFMFLWVNLFGFSCCKIQVTTKCYLLMHMLDFMSISHSFFDMLTMVTFIYGDLV